MDNPLDKPNDSIKQVPTQFKTLDCPRCDGRGSSDHPDARNPCDYCDGTGNACGHISFVTWLSELEKDEDVIRGYGVPLIQTTGLECWLDFYEDGYNPRQAILEDMSCWEG